MSSKKNVWHHDGQAEIYADPLQGAISLGREYAVVRVAQPGKRADLRANIEKQGDVLLDLDVTPVNAVACAQVFVGAMLAVQERAAAVEVSQEMLDAAMETWHGYSGSAGSKSVRELVGAAVAAALAAREDGR